jgi:EmrB/QacA subfamily drug resistance transporter
MWIIWMRGQHQTRGRVRCRSSRQKIATGAVGTSDQTTSLRVGTAVPGIVPVVSAPEHVRMGEPRGRWVLAATVLGSGVAVLDSTIVNVALPSIGRDLGAEFSGLQWTVNGYVLTLASFLLLGGALGDRYGRRRVFVLGTVSFAVASLLCGLAPNVPSLVAARLLQGTGAALLTPGSLALIQVSFTPGDRGRAVGAWSGLTGIAAAVGPLVGGVLVEVSWRLVFLVNVPLCALVVLLARRHVPESYDEQAAGRLDLPGALLGAAGLAGLTYALIAAGEQGWSAQVLVVGAAGVAAWLGFLLVEARTRHPMLPLGVFRVRQFSAANAVTFAVYAALGALFLLLVVHLQVAAGFSPLAAGSALLPVTAAMLLLSARSGALAARIGPRLQMSVGPLLCAGGVLLLLRAADTDVSYVRDVLPGVVVFGLGLAATVAPLTATVLAALDDRRSGLASAVNNAVARTAGLLAIAVVPLAAGLGGGDRMQPAQFADGFRTALLILAGLLLAGSALAAGTVRNPGRVEGVDRADQREPARSRHCALDAPPLGTGPREASGRMPG